MAPRALEFHPELVAEKGTENWQLAGLLIVSLVPALFWTGLIALGSYAFGYTVNPLVLTTIGAAIATFLALVMKAMTAQVS